VAKIRVRRTPHPAIYNLLTQKQLNKRANKQAAASLAASQAPILTQQQLADSRATAARAAMQAVGAAGAKMLAPVGQENAQAYDQAVHETQGLIGGLTGSLGQHMQADEAANDNFRSAMAPGSASQEHVNPGDVANAAYDRGAVIPGSSLASQGAAATAYGNELPALPLSEAANQQAGSVGQQGIDDQQYAQQLLDLATQQPQVRAQILDQLYQEEASKANAITQSQAQSLYAAQFGEKQVVDQANIANDRAQIAQGNTRLRQSNVRLQLQQQGLKLRSSAQALAVKKAKVDWSRIDSSASKATGFLMTKDGQYVTDKQGKKIPVAASAGGGTGTNSHSYQSAIGYAQTHFVGTPLPNPAYVPGVAGIPKYLKQGGGYTDDPSKAKATYDETFVQAQTYLMNRYGLTRAQARKALVTLGRKPDGKRSK
jgi:hypothetical protein